MLGITSSGEPTAPESMYGIDKQNTNFEAKNFLEQVLNSLRNCLVGAGQVEGLIQICQLFYTCQGGFPYLISFDHVTLKW